MAFSLEKSAALFQKAKEILVGGVNSPVRAFRGIGGNPLFIDHGAGAYVVDVDGNRYIDYVLSWGPLILGHSPARVVEAIAEQAARGTSYGAPCELEIGLPRVLGRRAGGLWGHPRPYHLRQGHRRRPPTFGKVIGGGLPVGAFGGRKEIMEKLAPEGPIYQAGTLSGNPLAIAAGIATLEPLFEEGVYERPSKRAQAVSSGMAEAARELGIDAVSTSAGSMFSVFFTKEVPRSFSDVKAADTKLFGRFFWAMLERGVYLAPSAFEAGFLSLAHTDEDIQRTISAAKDALSAVKEG